MAVWSVPNLGTEMLEFFRPICAVRSSLGTDLGVV